MVAPASMPSGSEDESNFGLIDELGFKRPRNFDYDLFDRFKRDYGHILAHRTDRWNALLTKEGLARSRKLKRFIRKGVPPTLRVAVWMETSGAGLLKNKYPTHYEQMLAQRGNFRTIDQISIDLSRTFPGNVHFSPQSVNRTDGLQASLERVLLAFACSNPDIGYCQGMNYIAAMLLLVTKDEETSFWLLKALLETLLPNYFTHSLIGLSMDVMMIRELVRLKAPAAFRQIERLDVCWEALITKWFMCLYSDVFPSETVLRIWDCMFYEGSKVLVRVAMALIMKNECTLAASDDVGDLMNTFKDIVSFQNTLNCHDFMQYVFKRTSWLSTKLIWDLRSRSLSVIEDQRRITNERREAVARARERQALEAAAYITSTSSSSSADEEDHPSETIMCKSSGEAAPCDQGGQSLVA